MKLIAGIDEAGRGPLAGPVVAAAVILPKYHSIVGLNDSKKISSKKRSVLYREIMDRSLGVGVGIVDEKTIDEINILNGTHKAMEKSIDQLEIRPDHVLIDGHGIPNLRISSEGIVKGDEKVEVIQAASIIAKVTRDRIMQDYAKILPQYGFEKHKGYGTKKHFEAIIQNKSKRKASHFQLSPSPFLM